VTVRNTSTCVEKTPFDEDLTINDKKHLHMRGENEKLRGLNIGQQETPPHAWRKPPRTRSTANLSRNTSTCVEKTKKRTSLDDRQKKHLHMRGEN